MENLDIKNYSYFILLFVSFIVPFFFSFLKKYGLGRNYKHAIFSIIIVSIPFIVWDILVTERGHWSFNPDYISGIMIVNLPLEEILFFIIIPFCCLFTWNVLKRFDLEEN